MNIVYETESFRKIEKEVSIDERKRIWNVKNELKHNLLTGKPLRYIWLREKKYENKRIYFIISFRKKSALLIAYGNKKEQEDIIKQILKNRETYFQLL